MAFRPVGHEGGVVQQAVKTAPRRRRKEQRPQEILQAALECFAANGFEGTRLDDVARRAGITKGTIYVYFANKEQLFAATLREKTDPVFAHLAGLMDRPAGPAIEILRDHLSFVANQMIQDPCGRDLMRILLGEGHRFPSLVDAWYADVMRPALAMVARIVEYGVARGEFRDTALGEFPQLLMAPTILCTSWSALFGERHALDLQGLFDAAIDLFANGLLRHSAPGAEGRHTRT